jgi:hypothetical protein
MTSKSPNPALSYAACNKSSTPAADCASLQAAKKAVYSIRVNSGWLGVGGNLLWIQSASMSNWGS